MNLIERVKSILLTPKTEWNVVNGESSTQQSLLISYVIPLAVVGAVGPLLTGLLWAGAFGFKFYLLTAVIGVLSYIVSYYVSAIIIDLLAPNFSSEKNIDKSARLAGYSMTPAFVGSLLSFIPIIGALLALAAWAYGIYLMYLGIGPLKKTPEDKKVIYMIVAIIIQIAVYFVVAGILGAIIIGSMGLGAVKTLGA
jgi:hypothetical protein